LRWLSPRFPFLTPYEFLSSSSPGVLLTFDDGFANNHDVVLPLLERFGAPAVFFVTTQHIGSRGRCLDFVERSARSAWGDIGSIPREVSRDLFDGLSESQLAACANHDLITIGAHSVSHPRLTEVRDVQLSDEIRRSKAALEELAGTVVDLFAYPFGDADARVTRAVLDAGFRAAFVEGKLPLEPSAMAIPRVGLHSAQTWYLAAKLSGLHEPPFVGEVLPG
jgi:peptidoglycan/xylan/chitin deacetylase (PgdA/CDA1 family)